MVERLREMRKGRRELRYGAERIEKERKERDKRELRRQFEEEEEGLKLIKKQFHMNKQYKEATSTFHDDTYI